jgi:hypothetical protein
MWRFQGNLLCKPHEQNVSGPRVDELRPGNFFTCINRQQPFPIHFSFFGYPCVNLAASALAAQPELQRIPP